METVQEVLERAYQAHFAGDFDAALTDYVWLFEDAAATDAQALPLRLSYVLGGWARLAEEFLPARQALVRIRDAGAERLLEGDAGPAAAPASDANADAAGDDAAAGANAAATDTVDTSAEAGAPNTIEPAVTAADIALFNDIRAINDKLGDLQNTWRLYQRLHARRPALARACARSALPSLLVCGDYALAAQCLPNPMRHLSDSAVTLNTAITGLDLLSHQGVADLLAKVYNYINELGLVLDLYHGLGDTAALESAQRLAVTLAGSAEARACVQTELETPGTTLEAMIEHHAAAAAVAEE